ncbi:hypothetical protein [Acetobacter pasteurianus]|uniref:Uncharacterized protein n=1 Tax=Acetobacter pasteurianus subsp. pasteurianus TaxID=481145 RepID=A0A1Y0XYV7_ACEPA|nr:hypothetical protein [Acetobacter pasteurianus]ARW48100.1 hypothetical protein S1001342_01777 [Acetobacter pasteurianus subsp. pasteurianus]
MRTREEQVSALACAIFNKHTDIDECIAIANKYIQEAEERARAECAADTRRLEWLEKKVVRICEPRRNGMWTECNSFEITYAFPGTIKSAIDAAMEGGK